MKLTGKMTDEELKGLLKRYNLNYSDLSSLLLMFTGAIISPQMIRVYVERGNVSAPMTAALRLLFRHLDLVHEQQIRS